MSFALQPFGRKGLVGAAILPLLVIQNKYSFGIFYVAVFSFSWLTGLEKRDLWFFMWPNITNIGNKNQFLFEEQWAVIRQKHLFCWRMVCFAWGLNKKTSQDIPKCSYWWRITFKPGFYNRFLKNNITAEDAENAWSSAEFRIFGIITLRFSSFSLWNSAFNFLQLKNPG